MVTKALKLPPNLVIAPNIKLRTKSTKWDLPTEKEQLTKCIDLMTKVLLETNGFGISAPQVGINKCVFMLSHKDVPNISPEQKFTFFINPRFLDKSKQTKLYWEGCLSCTKYFSFQSIKILKVFIFS